MPIYEYRCGDCNHRKEHLQKHSDAPIAACPACQGANYNKQLSAAGFQLKGTGWYATDFKGGGSATNTTSSGTSSPAASNASSETASSKTESASTSSEATSSSPAASTACGGGCACH